MREIKEKDIEKVIELYEEFQKETAFEYLKTLVRETIDKLVKSKNGTPFERAEYIDCLLSIEEDLEFGDYDHLNYKLHNYFYKEGFWIGNDCGEFSFDYHVSETDLTSENIYWFVKLAIKYLNNKYDLKLEELS